MSIKELIVFWNENRRIPDKEKEKFLFSWSLRQRRTKSSELKKLTCKKMSFFGFNPDLRCFMDEKQDNRDLVAIDKPLSSVIAGILVL